MAATGGSGGATGVRMRLYPEPGLIVTPSDCTVSRPPQAVVSALVRSLPVRRGEELSDWRDLATRLRVTFKHPELLRQALVHTSYLNENPGIDVGSNERLEFLGDAALGVVVAQELYKEYPDVDEGILTELRAHLVRRDTLARAAARFDLGDYLQLGRGEDAAGGRKRPTNLARGYEALIGALFLDGGLVKVRSFVKKTLKAELASLRAGVIPPDPKSRLQEVIQSRWQTTPTYKLVKTEGPDHARRFTVQVMVNTKSLGSGEGRSKQMAEKEAAQHALDAIEGEELGVS